ncbi:hypothetical protein BDP55DRAFT_630287 [Colletotrichum godetiae]|uniref:Uncharacterized protein n=1 Tax=Colletotrichum godetiae TaxID=1209918 RepID=A0AAJ0AQ56_9PEZI|nr:uncharacterized protein BDP55DRAFT_630287 [Colletotrichum godetiae]KAK1687632.1 hypothetical protein BDP55DRAFT_630287 [Colletotrichum godetiae]
MISSLAEMKNLKSPLDRLPLVIQHPSFFENPAQHLSSRSSSAMGEYTSVPGVQLFHMEHRGTKDIKKKDADDPVERKDSVMTDGMADDSVDKTHVLPQSSSVHSSELGAKEKTEIMTVRKMVKEFDEEGESSTAPSEDEKKKAEEMEMGKRMKEREIRKREMEKQQKKDKKKEKGESVPLPGGGQWGGDARWVNGARGRGRDAPGIFLQPEAPRSSPPPQPAGDPTTAGVFSPEPKKSKRQTKQEKKKQKEEAEKEELLVLPKVPWCHQSGGCRQKRGRRRRKMAGFAARSVDLLRRLFGKGGREKEDGKGKGRARCRICGDELGFAVERAEWQEDKEIAAVAAVGKETSSGAGEQKFDVDSDKKDMDRTDADGMGAAAGESRSTLATVRLTKIPEAWWTL